MKKFLSLLISFCGLWLLAGCGGSSPGGTTPPLQALAITPSVLPGGAVSAAYGGNNGYSLQASGGIAPFTWSWAAAPQSSLPPGLTISLAGVISGVPTSPGTYNILVTVTDSESPAAKSTGSITIAIVPGGQLALGFSALPAGTAGTQYGVVSHAQNGMPYTAFTLGATGGSGAYTWSWAAAQGSSLPPGLTLRILTLTSGGSTRCCLTVNIPVIDGTPSAAGSYKVIVTVTDSETPPAQANGTFTVAISASGAVASAMLATGSWQSHTRYKLIDLGTLGGPNSNTTAPFFEGISVPTLGQDGTFAGESETSTPDPFNPNCFNSDCLASHAIKWKGGVRTDLGALPGPAGLSSATTWISGTGLIVGLSENGEIDPFTGVPSVHGALWKGGEIFDLGTLKRGYESVANAVNDVGEVVGYANNATLDPDSLAGMGSQTRAVAWWNGEIHDLGTLGGSDAVALYVNNLGQIAGQSYTSGSVPPPSPHCSDFPLTLHGFFWENGRMVDLNTLGGNCTLVYALNNRGQLVGQSTLAGDATSHPFLWESGKMTDLGALGGNYGYAGWLNDGGEVVGSASNQGERALLAFSWKGGAMTNLGTLNGDACSAADAINANGQAVGGSGIPAAPIFPACIDAVEHAVLWQDGHILDLNALQSAPSGLTLNEATFINDRGEIGGFGTLANGETHAFVMIPCDANHSNVEGCDYEPVEAAIGIQAHPPQENQSSATNPATFTTPKILTRFRSALATRNHINGRPQASPR
jgi:probable HAF family extracellular repeat protein